MNKVILVTGACVNTGVDIVKKFASSGWDVVFTARDNEDVENKEKEYQKEFPNVRITGFHAEALIDEQHVNKNAIDKIRDFVKTTYGKIDAIVLNAADLGINLSIFEPDLDSFQRVLNTNTSWNYYIIETFVPLFDNKGSIVFINSNTAYRAIPNRVAYSASKGAQLGMMRALALDLGKKNIRVNSILPGMIITDRYYKNKEAYEATPSRFTPLGEIATGSDIAEAAYYLTCNARNTTGAELTVDGGNMIQLYPIINK